MHVGVILSRQEDVVEEVEWAVTAERENKRAEAVERADTNGLTSIVLRGY